MELEAANLSNSNKLIKRTKYDKCSKTQIAYTHC